METSVGISKPEIDINTMIKDANISQIIATRSLSDMIRAVQMKICSALPRISCLPIARENDFIMNKFGLVVMRLSRDKKYKEILNSFWHYLDIDYILSEGKYLKIEGRGKKNDMIFSNYGKFEIDGQRGE